MTSGSSSGQDGRPSPKRRRKLEVDTGVATIVAAIVLATGGLVGGFIGRAITSSPSHSPKSATPPQPVPKIVSRLQPALPNGVAAVACPQTISGTITGKVPAGDVLVIGYRPQSIPAYTFWPSVTQQGNSWSSTIYIGSPEATGHNFTLAYIILPASLRDYLIETFNQAVLHGHDNYWDAPDLPPYTISHLYQNVRQPNPHC